MLAVTETQLMTWLAAFLWPFLRVSVFVVTAPVLGTRALPARVRLIFAVGLTIILVPLGGMVAPAGPILSPTGLVIAVQQVLIGATLGLVLRAIFLVFEFSGQIVAQQMGLGFAAMVDPASGAQVPVVSQLYATLGILMFLAFNGHLQLIELLVNSFTLMPPGTNGITRAALAFVIDWIGQLLAMGISLMLPAIAALLIVNLVFGVIARSAPQFNIFSIGFPILILFGIAVLLMMSGILADQMEAVFTAGFTTAYEVLRRP
ncbi:MAG: flagellar biosynthetic protein FliR [Gammaproteobacteria bacterium]|nr:flagellar biosynthetic protein FliR [Gammaproteobacteria bacterium]